MKKTMSDSIEQSKEFIRKLEKSLEDLEEERDYLLEEVEEIEDQIKTINEAITFNKNLFEPTSKGKSRHTAIKNHDDSRKTNEDFDNYKGTDFFLWGLKKLGKKEVTVSEITEEVEKIDTDAINVRIKDGSLKQWMMVSADSLSKKGILKKNKNYEGYQNSVSNDRKGGVTFKLS